MNDQLARELLQALKAIVDHADAGRFITYVLDDGPPRIANYDHARELIARAEVE